MTQEDGRVEPQKEKFLVVLELETNNLSRDLRTVRAYLDRNIPDMHGIGWIVTDVLIDEVKAILKERGIDA